jgi:hypothetical protein
MKLSITEIEINRLLAAGLPPDLPVAKLSARVTPGGVAVTGEYHLMFAVPFRTEWEVGAAGGGVEAHLRDLQVGSFPAGKLRGLLLKLIRDAAPDPAAVRVDGERVFVDVAGTAARHGARVRPEVTALRLSDGVVEAEVVLRPA